MATAEAEALSIDLDARWIRVTAVKAPFVLFEFTLGDPDLMVEMIMPIDALFEFRSAQHAVLEIADEAAGAFAALSSRQ
ncbi:MAG: phenol hydroxylase subunit [Zavarzinia sp.]|nr:phenol hydroxylase subunit [Zavarzinia sp.]